MKRIVKMGWIAMVVGSVSLGGALVALATPSTQVWIPSTDIQPFNVWHLGLDNYLRTASQGDITAGQRDPNVYDAGLTVGVLPFEKVNAEVGVDYIANGTPYDDYPVYFNAKVGVAEGTLVTNAPALAVGGFGFGTNGKSDSAVRTDQDIVYGMVAKTIPGFGGVPSLGRLSAGYYVGNDKVLLGTDGKKANDGVLLSWDRTISEISDKLWLAVDYMGGGNSLSALSFGAAWSFSKNVSVIFGYDIYEEKSLAGGNTFTTQVDINFP